MKVAFVYPGQGGFRTGAIGAWDGTAGRGVAGQVSRATGLDVRALDDDPDTGRTTATAQPAILTASLAAHAALLRAGVTPHVVAGHSLGEVTAAVAAGCLGHADGARLVAERGAAMAAACAAAPGGMLAAVGLDDDVLATLVAPITGVTVANHNAPGQTVLSGRTTALERVSRAIRDAGGRARPLPVEGAFHSPAMTPAMVRFDVALRGRPVADPRMSFVTGTTGRVLRKGYEVRRALVEGVLAPVRWQDVQRRLVALDVDLVVEVGPGGVLRGLARRTIPHLPVMSVATPDDVRAVLGHLSPTRPHATGTVNAGGAA